MRIIKTGSTYDIYHDNSLVVCDKLPVGFYTVAFYQQKGFCLQEYAPITISEKIYGEHTSKAEKVLQSFGSFERNLGVILSGNKGIGKSLTAKLICLKAIEKNIPVIIVDKYVPGIASFLGSIEQEVLVLFDEFDKTFSDEDCAQTEMLSLFDGVSTGKKIFVITCNRYQTLNEFLVNRPGRFHYHFRFDYPSPDEIIEYLTDKVKEEYKDQIPAVAKFSGAVDLNYDCLRAIAFEINTGEPFEKAIKDLNILNVEKVAYKVRLMFTDGTSLDSGKEYLDLYNNDGRYCAELYGGRNRTNYAYVEINISAVQRDEKGHAFVVPEDFRVIWYDDREDKEYQEVVYAYKSKVIDKLVLEKNKERSLHYNLA